MYGLKVVCTLCDVTVLIFSEVLERNVLNRCASISEEAGCREGKENQDVCGAGRHDEDGFLAKVNEAAFGINFGLLGAPVLGGLRKEFYELGCC